MKQIYKEYQQHFLLEPTKFSRLVDTIHGRFTEFNGAAIHDTFEVFLSGSTHEEMTDLKDVFELENSRKKKIQRLVITSSAIMPGSTRPDHEVCVDFGGKSTINNPSSRPEVVAVTVRSGSPGWASRTLSEVEEQIERTWANTNVPIISLVTLLVGCLIVLLLTQIGSVRNDRSTDAILRSMWLSSADLNRVQNILNKPQTITEPERLEITTLQLRSVLADQRPKETNQKTLTRQRVFIGIPLGAIVLLGIILLQTCYPKRVFLWGDEIDRYKNLMSRRKLLWGIIISVTTVGVLGSLLYSGILLYAPTF